jgi:hypothetical protein
MAKNSGRVLREDNSYINRADLQIGGSNGTSTINANVMENW